MPAELERGGRRSVTRMLHSIARAFLIIPRAGGVLLVVAWAVLIWTLSAQSPPANAPHSDLSSWITNLYHAPEYGLFTLWILLAIPRSSGWPALKRRSTLLVLIAIVCFAIVDELHQSFTPRRDASVLDIVTNLVAASLVIKAILLARDPDTSDRTVLRFLLAGALACITAAALATFVPRAFPPHPGKFGV